MKQHNQQRLGFRRKSELPHDSMTIQALQRHTHPDEYLTSQQESWSSTWLIITSEFFNLDGILTDFFFYCPAFISEVVALCRDMYWRSMQLKFRFQFKVFSFTSLFLAIPIFYIFKYEKWKLTDLLVVQVKADILHRYWRYKLKKCMKPYFFFEYGTSIVPWMIARIICNRLFYFKLSFYLICVMVLVCEMF